MIGGLDVSAMAPMLVGDFELALEDIAATLLAESNGLAERMHLILRKAAGTLVRSSNCHYADPALVQRGILVAESRRAPLRLGCPVDAVERWFPRLYLADAGGRP